MQIKAVNAYSKLSLPEVPTLFVEFHGSDAGVAEQSQRFGDIVAELGGGPFDWATKPEDRSRLWQARHDGYWAARRLRPGAQAFATDVCVPISRLAECVTATQRAIAELNLVAPILGHVGDGNFHLSLLVDMADADEVRRAGILMERVVELALSMDGTCTGEHGVGQGKMKYLLAEHGRAGACRHGGDQARARPAEHHESGQDRRAVVERRCDIDLPPKAGKNSVHFTSYERGARRREGTAPELALQNTLLGLAIAIILALVAALVGPLLIDWGSHRSLFEAEASRLIGVDVRVTGAIEARLLPTPALTLHDIEIGGGGEDTVRARSLGFEFALGPLMRGEWQAAEVHLVGPQLAPRARRPRPRAGAEPRRSISTRTACRSTA